LAQAFPCAMDDLGVGFGLEALQKAMGPKPAEGTPALDACLQVALKLLPGELTAAQVQQQFTATVATSGRRRSDGTPLGERVGSFASFKQPPDGALGFFTGDARGMLFAGIPEYVPTLEDPTWGEVEGDAREHVVLVVGGHPLRSHLVVYDPFHHEAEFWHVGALKTQRAVCVAVREP